jgi:hypothetical protein
MPIVRVDNPNSTPTAVSDYQAQNTLIGNAYRQGSTPFTGSNMNDGYLMQIGGTLYKVDGATAISGTASEFVRVTPAGATASASFVSSLSGVSWNALYNGYYDGSGNLYVFDEVIAFLGGAVASLRNRQGFTQSLLTYLRNASNLNTGTVPTARTAALTGDVTKPEGSSVTTLTPETILTKLLTVDGPSSGLDSATVSNGYSLNFIGANVSLGANLVQTYSVSSTNLTKEMVHFTIAVTKTGTGPSTANFRCSISGTGTWKVYFTTTSTSVEPNQSNMGIDISGGTVFYTYSGANPWNIGIFGIAMRVS